MRNWVLLAVATSGVFALASAHAAGVRDFTRSAPGTAVSQAQANELTLTLTEAAVRPIQNWIRSSGKVDQSGEKIMVPLRAPQSDLVQIGQRVRAYTVKTRTRMNLARVTKIAKRASGADIEITLPTRMPDVGANYLVEIVVERGPYLSIPNVSIIEEGDQHIVYLQKGAGSYIPQAIEIGLQGELYTQVTGGLKEGDQIVSIGSFFVDAETKLKSAGMAAMPGMDHSAMAGAQMATAAPGTPLAATMTDPAANARVPGPLPMIHVMFNAPVNPNVSGFEVTKADGARIDVGEAMPMGANMLMAMPKTPLPAGNYKVKWHTVGADSKKLDGEFSFTVQ
jgi:methionine-rich copper-binding protein CopC